VASRVAIRDGRRSVMNVAGGRLSGMTGESRTGG
jgi:hypothetical protein